MTDEQYAKVIGLFEKQSEKHDDLVTLFEKQAEQQTEKQDRLETLFDKQSDKHDMLVETMNARFDEAARERQDFERVVSQHFGRIYGRVEAVEAGQREFGVKQDAYGSDLKRLAEGVTNNGERIDRLTGRFEEFENRLEHL